LYHAKGLRLGTVEGAPAICAAFHPRDAERLFVLHPGESTIQEYAVANGAVLNRYSLDYALVIPCGDPGKPAADKPPARRKARIATPYQDGRTFFRAFEYGRLKVSDNGEKLFAVVPAGVYMFDVKPPAPNRNETKPKPTIKVIETSPPRKD
jgi:hypothetical protein